MHPLLRMLVAGWEDMEYGIRQDGARDDAVIGYGWACIGCATILPQVQDCCSALGHLGK